MRCVKCGNEVNKEDFVCIYCSARLREEKIEKIPYFRRLTDEKWNTPIKGWKRFYLVFRNPSRAFWDIVHYRENIGSWFKVYFLSAIVYGFFGLAIFVHTRTPSVLFLNRILYGISAYLIFFLFGLVYFFFLYVLSIRLFMIGANYSINLKTQLHLRYGEKKRKVNIAEDIGTGIGGLVGGLTGARKGEKSDTMVEAEGRYTALPTYLTTQKSKKTAIMLWAFAPFLLSLAVSAILLFVALPVTYSSGGGVSPDQFEQIGRSFIWGITDWIQVIVLIGWIPITMTVALRELVNASTTKAYISCLIVSVLIGMLAYFFRPTILFSVVGS